MIMRTTQTRRAPCERPPMGPPSASAHAGLVSHALARVDVRSAAASIAQAAAAAHTRRVTPAARAGQMHALTAYADLEITLAAMHEWSSVPEELRIRCAILPRSLSVRDRASRRGRCGLWRLLARSCAHNWATLQSLDAHSCFDEISGPLREKAFGATVALPTHRSASAQSVWIEGERSSCARRCQRCRTV